MKTFSANQLLPYLPPFNQINRLWIAYSGGVDSHVLLHAMHELVQRATQQQAQHNNCQLLAVHINHGLSPNADDWQTHCEATCQQLNIPLTAKKVRIDPNANNIEAQARQARYAVFSKILIKGDYLLMGHHQNDQIETLLFRLMRSSGTRGLSAMPRQRRLANGQLLRPMLQLSRLEVVNYAAFHHLNWIEDESNQQTNFDRNFLRLEVIPLLQQRWPNLANSWQRTMQLCHDADQLQNILGEQDLEQVQAKPSNRLNISPLLKFSRLRQRNILRVWFDHLAEQHQFPLPGLQLLEKMIDEVILAKADASPLLCWSNHGQSVQVRRYANVLYALQPISFTPPETPLTLSINNPLRLSEALGELSLKKVTEFGFSLKELDQLQIRFRQGGESIKPAGRKNKSLKQVFQDYEVPPWIRDKMPLIYFKDELMAVGDLFISENKTRTTGENLYQIHWHRPDIHCGF